MKIISVGLVACASILTTITQTPAAQAAATPCKFEFAKDPYVQHGAVLVGGWISCDSQPESFLISLTVEFRPRGGSWIVRGSEQSSQVPGPLVQHRGLRP